ncbi:hypothetical protein [Malikia granosa]|uniref:Uncharacterized protein n=1 Tax=Malikia granosa TaxID=263067 RepID=A0A2S9K7Q5_9BURK|nr:hypothetical protein [Malikia granosa]PRD66432.1 hypothetical protein C6P64_03835 [Malikia granosa]
MTEIGKQQLSDALISTLDEFRNGQVVSREEQRNRRFNLLHRALLNDDAWMLDTHSDDLALDAIELLAQVLRQGHPTPEMITILADFLDSVLSRADSSLTARDEETKLARRIMGHQPNGRPNSKRPLQRALAAFEMHSANGSSQEEAERAAYDAYQVALGHPDRNYASSLTRNVNVTRGASVVIVTEAERLLDNTIRPELRKAGLIAPKARGRKPLQDNFNTEPLP